MATQNSNAGKPMKSAESKPAETKREAPAAAPQDTTVAKDAIAEASAADAPVVEAKTIEIVSEAKAPEPTAVAILPTPVVAESVDSQEFSAAFDFDASLWSKKYFELWAENAQAFLDLAEQIARAKTFEEAAALQSRFAGERFEAFLRQSKEVMTLAQRMATVSVAPLCGARAA
ncbi:phasin family protein [Methylocystis sp. WRRC1]|uniref:phasin family protein n=1 Tax=Methylocystis sp. WRRC1 TaxID=1732014 RepID=UPI001D155606|nr:phasin family protein [Methylocystis sp. WRRC1]MCC3245360.1 phasin family protein [Methylocystis sp. WRRC1]